MTYKEAINYLPLPSFEDYGTYFEEAYNMAIDVLEKADKYRWHDLRKDPTDLPTTWDDDRFYDCVLENHTYDGFYAHFEYVEDYGFGEYSSTFDSGTLGFVERVFSTMEDLGYEKVIAWKEIEPFEVEE